MNILADESVDLVIVERLRVEGHDVLYIAEMAPGISDDVVLSKANEQERLLLTPDKDFGELVYRLQKLNSGVVLLRLAGLLPQTKANLVIAALQDHGSDMKEAFSVISPGMVRIRSQK